MTLDLDALEALAKNSMTVAEWLDYDDALHKNSEELIRLARIGQRVEGSGPCVVVPVEPTDTPINPVVQEAIDNFGRYYAEYHKLGMSIRSDMQYIARLASRWAEK